jgi:hypothetical protein
VSQSDTTPTETVTLEVKRGTVELLMQTRRKNGPKDPCEDCGKRGIPHYCRPREAAREELNRALRAALDGEVPGREPNDDEWCCDGCGLIAPIDAEHWEQTAQDDAGVSVEFCPHCKHDTPWKSCFGRKEIYVGSMPYGGPGDSYAPCFGCPDCRPSSESPRGEG